VVELVGLLVMTVGLLMAAVPLLLNWPGALYLYLPLQAPWYFYLGPTLVVVVVG
jgi:hypothetical protein